MLRHRKNRKNVPKYLKQNKTSSGNATEDALSRMQKNIYRQAALALLTVVLTIVILFAMTSAWYTNIVQSKGLMFEAESWGFDGTITVNEESILAAPGDSGVVHLEVENASDSISTISVNVSKNDMQEEMKKRLFFYVDTQMSRDGETMDRVYLNNYEGYAYTIFSQGNLILTENASNAPQIKWQWVYDVLGYYVQAKPQEVIDENGNTILKMNITEYLRPIEYDFDAATITMDTDASGELRMVLDTVDGTTDPYIYLWQLSKKDGYKGEIAAEDRLENGFYPVDVDDNGYGVYAYMCNYTEIEMATQYDSELAELAYRNAKEEPLTDAEQARLNHTAKLTISAQKDETTAINVNTLDALQNVITQGSADVIQLSSNITIPSGESLTIPRNSRVMVDMNGYTLSSTSGRAVDALPGSSLTMLNGALTGPGTDTATYGIYTIGAEVVMSDVDVSGFRYGVCIGDNADNNPLDSRVHMVGCKINADWYAVFISGNGLQSVQKSQLIVENSTLSSNGIVITGSGNATGNGRWGTDIQILNSEIVGKKANETDKVWGTAIYQPQQNSTMVISNSTVTGYNGIALKGGSIKILDSTITGNGLKNEPAENRDGFTDTGDAVYIDTIYGYEILLEIDGASDLSSMNSHSLQIFKDADTNYSVKIYGGTFDEKQPDAFVAEGSSQTTSGSRYVVTAG